MEFYRELSPVATMQQLQRDLEIAALPRFCSEITEVLQVEGDRGEIYCLWGQFRIYRETINGGVRFALPGCPNALAWTVCSLGEGASAVLVVHCTINRRDHDPDFIDSIELFMDAWQDGLTRYQAAAA